MRQNMAFKAKSLASSSSHSKRNPLMRVMTFHPSHCTGHHWGKWGIGAFRRLPKSRLTSEAVALQLSRMRVPPGFVAEENQK